MSKENLLVDRRYLVGVSKPERIAGGDQFALGHWCLRTTYISDYDVHKDQDFFRGATARYWSFGEGGDYKTYNKFEYLNKTKYQGTLQPYDIKVLNLNSEENKIAFTIGGDEQPTQNIPVSSLPSNTPARPASEWLTEEIGEVNIGVFQDELIKVLPDGVPTPWNDLDPIWTYFGYPADLSNAGASLPGPYHGVGADGTPDVDNMARKMYIIINSFQTPWVAGSAELGWDPTDSPPPYYLTDDGCAPGGVWGNYWGAHEAGLPGAPPPWNNQLSDPDPYRGFMHNYVGNVYGFFKDHAHLFKTPYSLNDPIITMGVPVGIKVAKIEPKYNYFSKNYEKAMENPNLDERLLPNAYMIYNYIDYYKTDAGVQQIDERMRQWYRRLACFWQAGSHTYGGWIPSSRNQISQLGYKIKVAGVWDSKRSYIHRYSAHNPDDVDSWKKTKIKKANMHIGFTKEMVKADFEDYGQRKDFPFGIAVEFDTNLPEDKQELRSIFDSGPNDMPWAYDFIINNLIFMNLRGEGVLSVDDEWGTACGGEGAATYNEQIGFSAQVTEYVPNTLPTDDDDYSLFEPRRTYYGCDWVSPPEDDGNNYWGYAPGFNYGQEAVAEGVGFKNNTDFGNYTLRCLDVGRMFDYANTSRKVPRTETANADSTTYRTTPSALLGQVRRRGVARHYGTLVGPRTMNRVFDIDDWGPKQAYDELGPPGNSATVSKPTGFEELMAAFAKVIKKNSRSYYDMINGAMAYTETLAYKVCKHRVVTGSNGEDQPGELIQSFYFPNVKEMSKIRYFDTQVKYGVKYKYIAYACNLVIGNQYCYENIELTDLASTGVHFTQDPDIYMKPFYTHQFISAKIIETPYYKFETAQVRDLPPVFPEIETVPFKGINNKIRFLMQTQNVKYAFNPDQGTVKLMIDPQVEISSSLLQREYQQRPTGPIVYGSDDTEITFEIFRMTTKPHSYTDFAPHLHATVEGVMPTGQRVVSMGYDDDIKPNTNYYYTFRCTDYHGGISIPSPVYHVEIVDDNGRMFPVVEVFYIINGTTDSEAIKKVMKPLRKYLQVGAAFAQKIISPGILSPPGGAPIDLYPDEAPPTGLLGATPPGMTGGIPAQDSVWSTDTNKKVFKIRLTSKNTGKKIDLNVRLEEASIINPIEGS